MAPNFFRRYTAGFTCTKANSKIVTLAIILEAGLTIAFTADQLEKRHAIFSVVENFRCLTDIQVLKFNSLFLLAIYYLVLCCFPRSTRNSAEPVKRLWRTLVHQESIKELFIQNIFKREMASNEEVSPFLISLLCPVSFSFSSFLAFFLPSSLLLWLSLSSPSCNSFHTSLSPSLDPSSFLFFFSLPPSYFSPTHPFFPAPAHSLSSLHSYTSLFLSPVLVLPYFLFSTGLFLCHFLPLPFWSRTSFLFLLPFFVWAVLRICERLGHCCVELWHGTIWGDKYRTSFLQSLVTANKKEIVSPEQSHKAFRHHTDTVLRPTS